MSVKHIFKACAAAVTLFAAGLILSCGNPAGDGGSGTVAALEGDWLVNDGADFKEFYTFKQSGEAVYTTFMNVGGSWVSVTFGGGKWRVANGKLYFEFAGRAEESYSYKVSDDGVLTLTGAAGGTGFSCAKTDIGALAAEIGVDLKKFTVSFNTNGGTPAAIPAITVDSGKTMGKKYPADPTRRDHVFNGWLDGAGERYTASTVITKSTGLTAGWTPFSLRIKGDDPAIIETDQLSEFAKLMGFDENWDEALEFEADVAQISAKLTVDGKTEFSYNGVMPPVGAYIIVYTAVGADGPLQGPSTVQRELIVTYDINLDYRLILGEGEAWVDSWSAGNRDGYIFLSTGAFLAIDDYSGFWVIKRKGTWSSKNGQLTRIVDGDSLTLPYTVSGNTFKMDGDTFTRTGGVTVTEVIHHELSVNITPSGGGTVEYSASQGSVTGGTFLSSGKANIPGGTTITVTATPAAGYTFTGWSGASTSKNATIMLIMNGSQTLTANFQTTTPTTYTLTTGVTPAGGGTVSRNPNQTSYNAGTSVTVTATPAAGYRFTGWSGASASTSASITVVMNSNLTLTANFQVNTATYTLTTGVTPTGGGTVSRNPSLTNYSAGTQVTVTATPAAGYRFTGWSGASTSTSASITVTMNSNLTLTANFQTTTTTYTLTTGVTPTGGGTVSRNPNQTSYNAGTSVTVTATPAAGYKFTGWSGASTSTSASITVTMNSNLTLTARFEQTSTNRDSRLVLPDGEAWIWNSTYSVAADIFVFSANGEFLDIYTDSSGDLYLYFGTWSTSGNKITLTYDDGSVDEGTYTISSNTLTMVFSYGSYTYTRTKL